MTQYKTYAQEGNFQKNLQTVPDESGKILQRAEKQISARQSVEQFRQKTAELYRRAQEQAGIIEQNARKDNFKLEQDAKKAHIDAVQQNYAIELENNEARAAAKARDAAQLQAFSKTAFDFTNAILKKNADDRKKAASLAAYTHGFDIQTLKDVKQLNDGLTKSQFQQTDLFRKFKKEGRSEEFLQSLYDDVYKHRGSKRWVDNVAVLQNHAKSYKDRVTNYLDQHPNLTADEQLAGLANLRNQFILETDIDGKMVSAEVLNEHVFPALRKVDNAIQTSLQAKRSKQRDKLLDEDTMRGWDVALGPTKDNVEALHQALSMNPSFEKRGLFATWLSNSIRSGNTSAEQARAIVDHPIEINGKRVPWSAQFGSTEEMAQLNEVINQQRNKEHRQLQLDFEREKADKKVELATMLSTFVGNDGLVDDSEMRQARRMADEVLGVGRTSPELDLFMSLSTDNRAQAARAQMIEAMIASDTWTVEVANNMRLSYPEKTKYMNAAINRSKILKSPQRAQNRKDIEALVDSDDAAKSSPDKNNRSHLYMKDYMTRMYDKEVRYQIAQMGVSVVEAEAAANAKVHAYYENLKSNPDYLDKNGNYKQYQEYLNIGGKLHKRGEARFEELQKLRDENNSAADIIGIIGEKQVLDAYEQISKPGAVASEQWKQLAEIYGTDPLTMINMLAPFIGEDRIDPSSFELGKLKANMSPISQFELDRFQTNERTARSLRRAMGETRNAPVRGTFSQYRGPVQLPDEVKNDVHFMNGVNYLSEKYKVSSEDLLRIFSFETGGTFSPAQKNAMGSGATGLIQFMPATARGLGTTTEALANMSRVEQLQYVDKYLEGKGIEGGSFDDLYMAILFPVAVGKADNFVLFGQGATVPGYGPGSAAYSQNSGLDINNDGSITKAEAAAKAR